MESHTHEVVAIELVHTLHTGHTARTILAPGAGVFLHEGLVLGILREVGHREGRAGGGIFVVFAVQLRDHHVHLTRAGFAHYRQLHLEIGPTTVVATLERHVDMTVGLFSALAVDGHVVVNVGDVGQTVILQLKRERDRLALQHIGRELVGRQYGDGIFLHLRPLQTHHHRIGTRRIVGCLGQLTPFAHGTRSVYIEVADVLARNAHDGTLVGVGILRRHHRGDGQRVAGVDTSLGDGVRFGKRHFHPLAVGGEVSLSNVGHILTAVQRQLARQPSLAVGDGGSFVERHIDAYYLHANQRRVLQMHRHIVGLGLLRAHAFQRARAGIDSIENFLLSLHRADRQQGEQ